MIDFRDDRIRLVFDNFAVHFDRNYGWSKKTGWSLFRNGSAVLTFVTWEDVWSAMTTGEHVKCYVFANNLR
jgi:hypothetical protein